MFDFPPLVYVIEELVRSGLLIFFLTITNVFRAVECIVTEKSVLATVFSVAKRNNSCSN